MDTAKALHTPDAVSVKASGVGHIVNFKVLLATCAALLILTYATVAVSRFDLGEWNLFIALGIAVLKVSLVLLYFMHLRYDHGFYAVVLIAALIFILTFIGLALLDSLSYQPNLIPGYAPGMKLLMYSFLTKL